MDDSALIRSGLFASFPFWEAASLASVNRNHRASWGKGQKSWEIRGYRIVNWQILRG
jgi:hypothetical protein